MPARRPGSVRRTTHVDVGPGVGAGAADHLVVMVVRGAGHEVLTEGTGPTVADVRSVEAGFDAGRHLIELVVDPAAPWASAMVGARSGGGFRRMLAEATPAGAEYSLTRQLLDDLPAALLISGYSAMRLGRSRGIDPARMVPPDVLPKMTDLCSGWRAGGVAVVSIAGGRGVPVQDCPPSTDLEREDPVGWHVMPRLAPHWMRRRRCIDVTAGPDGTATIWAMFRDTVAEGDGAEVVLHEYSVHLSVGPSADGMPRIDSVDAVPAVLPFPECPAAADAARSIVGSPLAALPELVPDLINGIRSCTHLNDLLRSIGASAPAMLAPPGPT